MRLLLIITLLNCTFAANCQTWDQITDFSGSSRDDGCSFTIDNVVYCGTGRNAGFAVTSDFYAFDLSTELWTTIGAMPYSTRRQYAIAEMYNSEGYVFGGISAQGEYLKDLWRYNPTMNSWFYMGQAPFEGRAGMQSFVVGDILMIVGGRTATLDATDEVWGYNFVTNTWNSFSPVPGDGIWRGFGTSYNGTGIVGMGEDSTNTKRGEIYFYSPLIDSWSIPPSIDTEPMTYPAVSIINDRLFMYGGEDTFNILRNDFRYLDLTNLTWNSMNSFPNNARRGVMAFSSSSDFYITTGLTSTERVEETWVARSVAGIDEETAQDFSVRIQDGMLILPNNMSTCKVFSILGESITLTSLQPGVFHLPSTLAPGVYYCTAYENGSYLKDKFVIQ